MVGDEQKTGPLEVSRALTAAMEEAGVHPAYVHAVRRCGFVYTDENASRFSDEQVARWNRALDEWFDEHGGPDA